MEKILVPVDGSESSQRAVQYVMTRARSSPGTHIFLINVQEPPPAEIMLEAGLAAEQWHASHQTAGREALKHACEALDEAKLPYTTTVAVGYPAEHIAARAQELGCNRIVMGTRGLRALASLVLGSVAMRVVHAAACPVTLVK